MSIKEMAYYILDNLNEEQLKGFVLMFSGVQNMGIPNEKTLTAMQEAEDIISGKVKAKSYNSVQELFEDLES
ncbi:MAG: hypothetical protein ACI4JS_09290 [Oscillospiraceae bacterium]